MTLQWHVRFTKITVGGQIKRTLSAKSLFETKNTFLKTKILIHSRKHLYLS
jgi:type III secretory pathway component EscU